MYMQGIDFTFYWLTGEKTHLYLRCWENKRSKKLVNGVLPVCLLSYFVGKPKESAAWWALGIQRFINHWSRKCFCKGPVIIYRLGGGGGGVMGLVGWFFVGPLPLNDVLLKWSSSWLLINFVILPKVFAAPKKNHHQRQEERRKARGKSKKQCREKRLEAHQLLWNLEPVETADIYLPVEWTHLFYTL